MFENCARWLVNQGEDPSPPMSMSERRRQIIEEWRSAPYQWSSTSKLRRDVAKSLRWVATEGFSKLTADEIPPCIRVLPRYRQALSVKEPQQALQDLLQDAVDSCLPDRGLLKTLLEMYFGLDPDTAVLPGFTRSILAMKKGGYSPGGEFSWPKILEQEFFGDLSATLCAGAPYSGDSSNRMAILPELEDIKKSLSGLLKRGLPVMADDVLLMLVSAGGKGTGSRSSQLARLNRLVEDQLDNFEIAEWQEAARIVFARIAQAKGKNLTERREMAARTLRGRSDNGALSAYRFRIHYEQRIVSSLALQLYRSVAAE
jgi:hypothetical protein